MAQISIRQQTRRLPCRRHGPREDPADHRPPLYDISRLRQPVAYRHAAKPPFQLGEGTRQVLPGHHTCHLLWPRPKSRRSVESQRGAHHLRPGQKRHNEAKRPELPLHSARRIAKHQEPRLADHNGGADAFRRTPPGSQRHADGKQSHRALLAVPLSQPHDVRKRRGFQFILYASYPKIWRQRCVAKPAPEDIPLYPAEAEERCARRPSGAYRQDHLRGNERQATARIR